MSASHGAHHGAWVWYELMTTDMAAAAAFYGDVVGWQARDSGLGDMDYTLFGDGARDVCGLMAMPAEARANGARPSWVGYIAVDDVDRTATEISGKGGAVHRQPAEIPGIGRFAVVADPQGAPFVIFRSETPLPPPAPRAAIGGCGWRELMAVDLDQAFAFYADLFGWTKADAIDMGPMGPYQLFARDDVPIGGMMRKPAQLPTPPWRYYFQVDGLEAAVARIKAGGGTIVSGPHEVPGDDWVVHATDPQGVSFALVSHAK